MNKQSSIDIRRMDPGELERMSEIDRSERVTRAYEMEDGALTQVEVDWDVAAWTEGSGGDHSLSHQKAFCRSHLDRGGVLVGAFSDDSLVGIAVVRPKLREDMAQLAFLHITQEFRRRGIATTLMGEAREIARQAGARRMYVSSIPSSSAVGFYLAQGCHLAEDVDPELFALEPKDIHLILNL
jgi:GNAT superfamily N-acetyltransferase